MSNLPMIFRVRQRRERPRVDDPASAVRGELERIALAERIRSGASVAITAGSRGIANIATIVRAAAEYVAGLGARPFVVPAMGSHGGGTVEGQLRILSSYGITEAAIGCRVRASMETVVVTTSAEGIPVHFDRHAYEADHVLVCGRVKPHTNFTGEVESGLLKMLLIGLGKHAGASVYHRAIQDYSFDQILRSVAGEVLARCPITAGLAIVENAYDETARIEAVAPEAFFEREKELLAQARQWLPRLPFSEVDVLLVDEMGKDISGTGMDTNVIGRKAGDPSLPPARVKRIVVRGLTPATHGNATGIGHADFCHARLLAALDHEATRVNCLTAGNPAGARIPIAFGSDRELLEAACRTIGLREPPEARLLWIRNTLALEVLECSVSYYEEARARRDLDVLCEPRPLRFDARGDLLGPQY